MSQEQKPPEKSLADQRVDKILEKIAELKKELEKPIPSNEEKHLPQAMQKVQLSHFDPKDLETTCPDCKKKIDDFKQKVGEEYAAAHALENAQKLYKDRSVHTHKCTNCGLGVNDEELKDKDRGCVLCGNKQAR